MDLLRIIVTDKANRCAYGKQRGKTLIIVIYCGRLAGLSSGACLSTSAVTGLQKGINANKNPEFLVSPPGQLLVGARTYDRSGDFSLLHYHSNR